jgi:uncharacterized membrane protein
MAMFVAQCLYWAARKVAMAIPGHALLYVAFLLFTGLQRNHFKNWMVKRIFHKKAIYLNFI